MIPIDAKSIADWIGDRAETYDYHDSYGCALAQYLAGNGATETDGGPWVVTYTLDGQKYTAPIPDNIESAVLAAPRNFQSLKARLLEIA